MKKNVQVAEEKTPDPNVQSEQPQPVASPVPGIADNGPGPVAYSLPIDVSTINPQSLALAEKFGVPIRQILLWAQSVETRLNSIQESLPKEIGQALDQAIAKARAQQPQPQPIGQMPQDIGATNPGGLQGYAPLLQLLPSLLQGGTSQSDLLAELSAKALKGQIAMSEAITNAVVSKIAARATDEVAGAVVGS